MRLFVLALCILLQIFLTSARILPKSFPEFCSKSDPNYNKCMEKAFQRMGPYLLKGVKAIDFPTLHPLIIPSFSVSRELSDQLFVSGELKNLQFYGYDALDLKKFEFDPNELTGRAVIFIPKLDFKFEFDALGRVGNFKITNAGFASGNATGLDLEFNFKLKTINRVGIDYLTIDKFEATGDIQNAQVKLVSKNPENQPLSDFTVNLINEHYKELVLISKPLYQESLSAYYGSLVERFLSSVPASEIIPQ